MKVQPVDILIVEDNPGDIDLFKEFFRDIHLMNKITWARNGEEAMAIILRDKPDLVLIDLFMPLKTGADVLREVRSNPELDGVRVIIVSGSLGGDQVMRMAPGADSYVEKPIGMENLGIAVTKIRSFGISVVKTAEESPQQG